jgi:aldose 1-epimerase
MKIFKLFVLLIFVQFSACQKDSLSPQIIPSKNFEGIVDGKSTSLFTLQNKKGMTVQITNYGARVVALWVPDKDGNFKDVVWGFTSLEEYLKSTDVYCGPIVGRYGNRIANGQFSLNDSIYQLTINNNENHLHGGTNGFYKKVWDAKSFKIDGNDALELTYFSKDGEEGYPGNLNISVTYIVTQENELNIHYAAKTDATTIINPTSHCYFNLTGSTENSILEHVLQINAKHFTPTNETLIPTGEIKEITGTPFDFLKPTSIGQRIDQENQQLLFGKGYDHNFVIDKSIGSFKKMAEIYSPKSGIAMSILSDQPGLQFYSGNFMKGILIGKRGDKHNYRSGFALETQNFPDAPNHANFPSAILNPNETYIHKTTYRFHIAK